MANTFKFGNGNWAVKDGFALAYNDENNNFKPLPFDFTRASSATRVNKQGLIETVGSGKPRIDFTDNTSGHLLLEPSRTNKMTYSENFTSWAKSAGSSVSIVSIDNPVNSLNANFITVDASGIYKNINTGDASTTYSISFWLQKNSQTGSIQVQNAQGTSYGSWNVNLDLLSNDFVRITEEHPSVTVVNDFVTLSSGDIAPRFVSSSSTKSFYVTGFQMEAGSYATSYIPTEGSSVTRVAELCMNGGLNAPVFNNNTAVWFVDLERFGYDSDIDTAALTLRNSSNVEQIRLHFDHPNETMRFRDGKASFATIGGNISIGVGTRKKVALKIDGTTLKVFADGNQVGSNYTRPTAFDIDYIELEDSSFKLFDTRFYNTALTDTELQNLTS